MERQLFRAVCLPLLLGTVLSCVASETSEQKPAANFTTTIPKEGLERDVEQVFYLGPSSTLQVIDETGKAKYLPEPSTSSDASLAESYPAAYQFENGACDFSKTVDFKAAFPGYTKPLWVADEKGSGASGEASSGGPVRYTFTNPPAECLSGVLSFCVRFKTVLAAGSDSATSSSTAGTTENSDLSTQPGDTGEGEEEGEGDNKPTQPNGGVSPPKPGAGGTNVVPENGVSGGKGPPSAAEIPDQGVSSNGGIEGDRLPEKIGSPEHTSDTQVVDTNLPASITFSTSTEKSAETTLSATENGHEVQSGDAEDNRAPSRRLGDTPAVKEAYLTVVVHSAAWGSAGGMGAALGLLLTAVAAGLHFL
ncbi:unnamed protein product [Neospora caninum Liverpool]|uniref:Toxoplasma gondii family A protein n=1 Tax=Neospora caninum (strain Liverpool) TaxID=572307 RepID=F0VRJ8_NEOCL|nr:uncharacterized protein NCLIV_067710 [Neospora caninum Liverpool]CBZ56346.1 unnamed protein product [Neospora caninum Liverpool]CEL71106.1 TPA: hypothetical protein BN1204_067710 [Neospora caninum Liverpool]|eukprot:XP_003886371.1 uncharacterized protein NCLIV_067710 [Neospora caninum Liverpool]